MNIIKLSILSILLFVLAGCSGGGNDSMGGSGVMSPDQDTIPAARTAAGGIPNSGTFTNNTAEMPVDMTNTSTTLN